MDALAKMTRHQRCSLFIAALLAFGMAIAPGPSPKDNAAALQHLNWTGIPELTSEQLETYHRSGYLILRDVIPPEAVEALSEHRPARMLPWLLSPVEYVINTVLDREATQDSFWAESDFFYNFWTKAPLAGIVNRLFPETSGVRLLADLYIRFSRSSKPMVLGTYHKDSCSFSLLSDESPGVTAWVPLDDIDADNDGGSIWLVDMARVTPECQWPTTASGDYSPECEALFDTIRIAPNWRRGDALLFSKDAIHKTQPLLPTAKLASRVSFVGRLTTNDAKRNPGQDHVGVKLKFTHCDHGLARGENISSTPCYPQLYPDVVAEEKAARDSGRLGLPSNLVWVWREMWSVIGNGGRLY